MFRWLFRLFGFDSRGLFRFHDGVRWRTVDPIEVTRRLFQAKDFDWDETPALLRSCRHAPMELEALRQISTAIRAAFALPSVAAGGLTELDCWYLFRQLSAWLGDVKKNGSLFPILPNDTDSTPSPPAVAFPTKPGQGSGSTSTGRLPAPVSSPPAPTPAGSARE